MLRGLCVVATARTPDACLCEPRVGMCHTEISLSARRLCLCRTSARYLPVGGYRVCSQWGFRELHGMEDLVTLGLTSRSVDLAVLIQSMRSSCKGAHFYVCAGEQATGSSVRLRERVLVSGLELVSCGSVPPRESSTRFLMAARGPFSPRLRSWAATIHAPCP